MLSIFYIGKRTLFDILRTGVFWVTLVLLGTILFLVIYNGFRTMKFEMEQQENLQDKAVETEYMEEDMWEDPLEHIKPEVFILWIAYGITIGISNLLAIFIMMGLLGRELDRRTIELLIARPVSRGQIYFGKLAAGWVAIMLFMFLITLWTLACQLLSGMDFHPEYMKAAAIGVISPCLIGAITLFMTLWFKGFLAGLLATIITASSGTFGLSMLKWLGIEVLKLDWLVNGLFKILPPFNVIGKYATEFLATDLWFNMAKGMFEGYGPSPEDGLYSEIWQVGVYLGVVLIASWLSFFRRQFN